METCPAYRPWHDKKTHQTFLKSVGGKCLHYYFYFIDEELGLCYLRVPTWAPFRLQFYFNGHNVLAAELRRHSIDFTMADNALVEIADIATAQLGRQDVVAIEVELETERCRTSAMPRRWHGI